MVTRSAAHIRRKFSVPDQATEDRMVRAFRAALRPRKKAGRKPERETANAAGMWVFRHAGAHTVRHPRPSLRVYQRLLWQRIYRAVFPGFDRLDAGADDARHILEGVTRHPRMRTI